jgi:hypothetical protein
MYSFGFRIPAWSRVHGAEVDGACGGAVVEDDAGID